MIILDPNGKLDTGRARLGDKFNYMINLNFLLKYETIENLGYSTEYIEKPVADIVDFDWKNILKPPSSNTSKKTMSEIYIVFNATINRSKKDIEQVMLFDKLFDQDSKSPFISLSKQYNIEYPYEKILLFYNIIRPIIFNIKSLFNRPRPAELAKYYDIPINVIVTDTHHSAAYPSGHTVYSSMIAKILKYYNPKIDQKKLDKIVTDTAQARVLQGVHFPSDNKASLLLTEVLFDKLKDKIL